MAIRSKPLGTSDGIGAKAPGIGGKASGMGGKGSPAAGNERPGHDARQSASSASDRPKGAPKSSSTRSRTQNRTQDSPRATFTQPRPKEDSGTAGLASQASLFIRHAASVLEREVAAGIIATRSIENRFVDVAKVRGSSPNEVMQRFRRDAHDMIDIVMDLLAVGVQSVEGVAQRAIRVTQSVRSAEQAQGAATNVPTISPEQPAQPGSVVIAELALENSGDEKRELGGFQVSDLITASGERIEAQRITFDPLPVAIEPHGKARLSISIAVPDGARPGVYSGLMMATQMDQVRALIAVQVAGPAV